MHSVGWGAPCFGLFRSCEGAVTGVCDRPVWTGNEATLEAFHRQSGQATRIIMEDSVQKSCWGVTAKAVIGFACIILVAWLVGGAESTAVLATAG